ncbi:MAG: imidazole glycerol phosphate synthase subunit HisH [Chloroflexota bacterium]|nr:imidazole glycerol phosphate synthase subunit HisH [Dehalococcoidia bacterium]MDW8252944.1 imidazole glycerol phosphate synthase subunit HisH [Chloroflexota bacterium]
MIAIVDYGMGNLHSVRHAFELVGAEVRVTRDPEELYAAERIVLPGVGAFGECVKNLEASGLRAVLAELVLERGTPFLGICLGMQVLATLGEEFGRHEGLGWVPGVVRRFAGEGLRIPHVGWNEIAPQIESPLFRGLGHAPCFYFVHSYHFVPDDPRVVAATCDYGGPFPAAILSRNIFATQFHPEKSQAVGLRLLENFLEWEPVC